MSYFGVISDNIINTAFTVALMAMITVALVCLALGGRTRAWTALAIAAAASGAAVFLSLDAFDPLWGEAAFRELGWGGVIRLIVSAFMPVAGVGTVLFSRAYSSRTFRRGFEVDRRDRAAG